MSPCGHPTEVAHAVCPCAGRRVCRLLAEHLCSSSCTPQACCSAQPKRAPQCPTQTLTRQCVPASILEPCLSHSLLQPLRLPLPVPPPHRTCSLRQSLWLHLDMQAMLLVALLHRHSDMWCASAPATQDLEFAVRQTASIERQVEAGALPAPLRRALCTGCGVFYSRSAHVQAAFRQLDHARCG